MPANAPSCQANLAATASEFAIDVIDSLDIDDSEKVQAFDIVLDEGKAKIFLRMKPHLQVLWIRKQLKPECEI
jgi:hypothetical protein